jgi:hypothetical protein
MKFVDNQPVGVTQTESIIFVVNANAQGTITNWAEIQDDNGNDRDSTTGNGSQNEDDDDSAYIYVQIDELTTCIETELTPTWVELYNGDFVVTCEGANVEEFGVWVTVP